MSFELSRTAQGRFGGPVLVVVMDGVGLGPDNEGNAVRLARTPVLDRLGQGPWISLMAHGTAVGLPTDGDMGNSEVGHNALGAGRVFAQGAKRVNQALKSGDLFEGQVWRELTQRCLDNDSALHFLGLLSDGNVHSHIDHLLKMITEADRLGVKKVFVHTLLDGRDVGETSALQYVDQLEAHLKPIDEKPERTYRIASGGGRMKVTMDRYEADWGMVELGWKTHVLADAPRHGSAREAIESMRDENPGVIDQDLGPFVVGKEEPVGPIRDGDSVIFFNFRGDRAIEISRAFDEDAFDEFDRRHRPDVLYAGMMEYDGDYHIPKRYLVEPPMIDRTMGEYLAKNGVRQFACSETQKFGHVTYFWNGNRGGMFDEALEKYVKIPSDRVPFEERPWMKAAEITDTTIEALLSGDYDFLRINYANGDMVGHTGVLDATIIAVESVDLCLGRLLKAVKKANGIALVTADHGNADEMFMWNEKKQKFEAGADGRRSVKTSHTLNPVPLYLYAPSLVDRLDLREDLDRPGLANVAATVFQLLGFQAPEGYEPSLLRVR